MGNWIGLDATGAAALANGVGVHLTGPSFRTVIGNAAAGTGNVIAGNTSHGPHVDGAPGNGVYGNRFGTDASGMLSIPNGQAHIRIDNGGGATIGISSGSGGNLVTGTMPVGVDVNGLGTP